MLKQTPQKLFHKLWFERNFSYASKLRHLHSCCRLPVSSLFQLLVLVNIGHGFFNVISKTIRGHDTCCFPRNSRFQLFAIVWQNV